MAEAKQGDTVKVHYTGKLNDGTVFGSSVDREPLQLTIGNGQVIPDVEQAVVGMNPGESKTVKVLPEQAYGLYQEEMVVEVDRNQLPSDLELEVGKQLQVRQQDGQKAVVTVVDVSESSVKLDANHPLAGEELTFDLQLVEII
ncbi:MAG: FKBP-type peptidyl-prolyl cis-trans isomerase [Planctomycetota bacterium]|jgi:FKBP-type peptidyl-prolyl cis-trans isomerase 2